MNKHIKCGNCGMTNWRSATDCVKCKKNLREAAFSRPRVSVVPEPASEPESKGSKAPIFLTVLGVLFVALLAVVVYSSTSVDQASKVSLMTQYYWNVPPPPEELIRKAVNRGIYPVGYKNRVTQQEVLAYEPDCPDFESDPPCRKMKVDYAKSRPTTLETNTGELRNYRVVSSRIERVNFAGTPDPGQGEYVRYTAKIVADMTKIRSVQELGFKTGKDEFNSKNETKEMGIMLKWNEKTREWVQL